MTNPFDYLTVNFSKIIDFIDINVNIWTDCTTSFQKASIIGKFMKNLSNLKKLKHFKTHIDFKGLFLKHLLLMRKKSNLLGVSFHNF